jgi:HSP20 family molecular chaperone IbpA
LEEPRAISLPSEVIPDSVKANYKNGVLEVRMRKKVKTEGGKAIKVE